MGNELFFSIEKIIIIGVISYQFIHSIRLYVKIKSLESIFDKKLIIDSTDIENKKITLVKTTGENKIIIRIKDITNSYLKNNFGAAVNFSIIKDIIDREVDVMDEEISQSIPTPLYLGLAATMIGIIFGLLAMPELNGDGFSDGINALIKGVQYAMFASLSGLLCTTLLSSFFYKKAKRIVLKEKNDQLSYLQATLLPELVKAEDTGVSGLKASLDRFAREATKISDNVILATNQTGVNLQKQLDIISKVENLNMTRVSKTNLELFNRLESNMEAFQKFSTYLSLMSGISKNLESFSSKTTDFEIIATEIKSTLSDSKDLTRFLAAHFQEIQKAEGFALQAVGMADSHFRDAIEKLTNETNSRIEAISSLSNDAHLSLKQAIETMNSLSNDVHSSLKQATKEQIQKAESLALQAVGMADSHFRDAIEKLTNETNSRIEAISSLSNDAHLSLKQAIETMNSLSNDVHSSLKQATEEQIQKVEGFALQAVGMADSHFRNTIEKLTNETNSRIEAISSLSNDAHLSLKQAIETMNSLSNDAHSSLKQATEAISSLSNDVHSSLKQTTEEQIQKAGGFALRVVNMADSHFRDAIEKLTNETNSRIEAIKSLSNDAHSSLKQATEEHLQSFSNAYQKSVPQFNQLDYLKILPEFKEAINQLNKTINGIGSKIDEQSELLEKNLKRKNSEKTPIKRPKRTNLIKQITSLFRKKIKAHEE
ncbi:hypothetical protein EZS27_013519 [termite gut metagenome]|uniref:MotA/TolQ/ExbB proton channel domain-containing protein n=1 Tax=termite gut metagenome TaxID=433724 RepID=A0A5J4RZD5_9ZZZZ